MILVLKKIKKNKYYKTILFFIYEGMYLILLETFNQNLICNNANEKMLTETILFNIVWILTYLLMLIVLKPKVRKIFNAIFNSMILLFALVNYFLTSYFGTIFSWKDLFLSNEGLSFVSSIYKFISLELILFILICITMNVLMFKTKTIQLFNLTKKSILIVIIVLIGLLTTRHKVKNNFSKVVDGWNSQEVLSSYSYYYTNWIEPTKLLKICGGYEYLIRDFYFSFIKKEDVLKAKSEVEDYIKNNNIKENNEYTGIFKDKNLIFIMMESMDDWLINEETTPTIYEMMQHGFNFNNHYSPGYVTGDTANTEFIANTGVYPYINKLSPNYAYVNNYYPYSIANLFKNNNYIVNSFHRSNGFIYNRENMHISLGYEKYYNYSEMGISADNLDLDTYIIRDGYKYIVNEEKFMSFIITYSPHSPYTYDKIECQTNLEEIKKIYPEETNEEILCAYSSARETDNMFKLLLEKLEQENLLKDTVIVAFSDHPNRILINEYETETLNKTSFFIYESSMNSNQIYDITSTINILPTIINLFGIETDYVYPGYDAIVNNENYVVFKDYTYYDGKEIKRINDEMNEKLQYSFNILVSDYYKQ